MPRQMYDSTNLDDIPGSPALVGYYAAGPFQATPVQLARKAASILVGIADVPGTTAGTVVDVERGAVLPWEAPDEVQARRAVGKDPTVYVSVDNQPATITEFVRRGVPLPWWWLADWDGVVVIPAGAVAKQYEGSALTGAHYDLSVVADFWPGVDSAHGQGQGSRSRKVELYSVRGIADQTVFLWIVAKSQLVKVDDATSLPGLAGANVPLLVLDDKTLANLKSVCEVVENA